MPTYDRKKNFKCKRFKLLDTEYDEKQPNLHNNFRPRNLQQEQGSPIMKYSHKDTKERIQEKLSQGIPKMSTEV